MHRYLHVSSFIEENRHIQQTIQFKIAWLWQAVSIFANLAIRTWELCERRLPNTFSFANLSYNQAGCGTPTRGSVFATEHTKPNMRTSKSNIKSCETCEMNFDRSDISLDFFPWTLQNHHKLLRNKTNGVGKWTSCELLRPLGFQVSLFCKVVQRGGSFCSFPPFEDQCMLIFWKPLQMFGF